MAFGRRMPFRKVFPDYAKEPKGYCLAQAHPALAGPGAFCLGSKGVKEFKEVS